MESFSKPLEATCSAVPHTPVRVTNVNTPKPANHDSDATRLKLAAEQDPSTTPKKMPAKKIFKRDPKHLNNAHSDDASFHDFLAKVKQVAQRDTRCIPGFDQLSMGDAPPLPQLPPQIMTPSSSHTDFTMNPQQYAKYYQAKKQLQAAISRGNSFNSLHNISTSQPSPQSMSMSPASSPGAEWVADSESARQRIERAWNEDALIARHAFPSSIFCSRAPTDASSTPPATATRPSPESSLDLSEASTCGTPDHTRRRAPNNPQHMAHTLPNLPAALSNVSSSSWSEEEQMGVRKFLQLLERRPSFSRPQHHCRQTPTVPAAPVTPEPTLVEISPGVSEPLRPASETVTAVKHDFYVLVTCFGCSQDNFCIADAKYVICPDCRVVSPIEQGALEGRQLQQHGLGLGFTCESLFQIQSELLATSSDTNGNPS